MNDRRKKHFTDIIQPRKPSETIKREPKRQIKRESPKKIKALRLALLVVSLLMATYLLFYISSLNIGDVFKNAFLSLLTPKTPQPTENVFKKFTDEVKNQMESSGISDFFKSLPASFGNIDSIGGNILSAMEDIEYLNDYGLALSLSQRGDLVIEKLKNLKNNFAEINESAIELKNQPFSRMIGNNYQTTTEETFLEKIDSKQIENFIAALIDWLKVEPTQHLLMVFEDSEIKFYSDIALKDANIVNIATKNAKDKNTKFGGTITISMPVIEEISQISGFDFESQNFPDFFPQLLEKIANADKDLRPVIYGKIGDAFNNKEILVSFPDKAIQTFFEVLSK